MKKIASLLLAVTMVLSLAACGGNETATDNDNGSSTTQNQTDVTDTSSTERSTDASSSTTDNIGGSDSTDVPSSTISKPATTTKPKTSKPTTTTKPETSKPTTTTTKPETTKPSTPTHTHSYSDATCTAPAKCSCGATSGSALGHNWVDATCQAVKTCDRCGKTEGVVTDHSYSAGVCKDCGATRDFIKLPSTPIVSVAYFYGDIHTAVKITDISYKVHYDQVYLYFTGEYAVNNSGRDGWPHEISYKLYDSEGYIVKSGSLLIMSLQVGDKFKDKLVAVYGLDLEGTYRLEVS